MTPNFVAMANAGDSLIAMTAHGDLWRLCPGSNPGSNNSHWYEFASGPDPYQVFVALQVWYGDHVIVLSEHGATWDFLLHPSPECGTWRSLLTEMSTNSLD